SRLSYLLWGSMPDDALFAAAKNGELRTKDEIASQARRMLDDPRARDALANFHAQWLGIANVDRIRKDPAAYPLFDAPLPPLWQEETEAFLARVTFDEGGDVATIFSAPYSMMNAELAA